MVLINKINQKIENVDPSSLMDWNLFDKMRETHWWPQSLWPLHCSSQQLCWKNNITIFSCTQIFSDKLKQIKNPKTGFSLLESHKEIILINASWYLLCPGICFVFIIFIINGTRQTIS